MLKTLKKLPNSVQRGHYTRSVKVWWGVSYEGGTERHFYEKGIKTSALVKIPPRYLLEKIIKSLNNSKTSSSSDVNPLD